MPCTGARLRGRGTASRKALEEAEAAAGAAEVEDGVRDRCQPLVTHQRARAARRQRLPGGAGSAGRGARRRPWRQDPSRGGGAGGPVAPAAGGAPPAPPRPARRRAAPPRAAWPRGLPWRSTAPWCVVPGLPRPVGLSPGVGPLSRRDAGASHAHPRPGDRLRPRQARQRHAGDALPDPARPSRQRRRQVLPRPQPSASGRVFQPRPSLRLALIPPSAGRASCQAGPPGGGDGRGGQQRFEGGPPGGGDQFRPIQALATRHAPCHRCATPS